MVLSEKEARRDWECAVRVQFRGSNLQWWKADWWFLGSGGRAGQGRWGDYKAHKETYRGSRCVHYRDGDDGFTDVPWMPTLIKLHTWDMRKFVVSPLHRDKALFTVYSPLYIFSKVWEKVWIASNYIFSAKSVTTQRLGIQKFWLYLASVCYAYSLGRASVNSSDWD